MAQPARTTITIDGTKFDATSANFGISTNSDASGAPVMGSFSGTLDVEVDLHDTTNFPFDYHKKLFGLANLVTKDKIKDVKVEFWEDDSKQNVVCSYAFKGWIRHLQAHSNDQGANNILALSIQPVVDTKNFGEMRISN